MLSFQFDVFFLFVCCRTNVFDITAEDVGQVRGVEVTRGSGSSWHLKQVRSYLLVRIDFSTVKALQCAQVFLCVLMSFYFFERKVKPD